MLGTARCFILATMMMLPSIGLAQEAPEEPQLNPLCEQSPPEKKVKTERVGRNKWPDGSIKYKSIYFTDGTWVEYEFYQSGKLRRETHSTRYPVEGRPKTTINGKHGTEKLWHENGQLQSCCAYEKGKPVGTKMLFDTDGTPLASWTYEDGREVEHLTYSRVFGWQHFEK
ncbi:MAG: hypothetical protein JXR96_02475 [Deltaproteobacteria bacterium]|nr:hypothetical protein [Deltaproteobacteria bacterium]